MMEKFNSTPTPLEGLYIIEPKPIKDSRGYFERYFCMEEFKELGLHKPIAQINHSKTIQKGSIRGMHYQVPPFSEIKIIRCIKGKILDIALDIRKNSPTFLQYFSIELSEENTKYLYIPEGFAHGFQALSKECEILYLVSTPFNPQADSVINPLDPLIHIQWQEEINDISEKDKNAPLLDKNFEGISV